MDETMMYTYADYQNARETKLTKSKSLRGNIYGLFVGVVLLVGIVANSVFNYVNAVEIEGYSTIDGQVVDCGVLKEKTTRTFLGRSEWKDADFCFIKYSYLVQGKQYSGVWKHAMDEKFTSYERRKLCRSWDVGEPITVYYNPTNHAESELIRPSRWPSWWHWAFSALSVCLIWFSVDDIHKEMKLRRRVQNGESVLVQMGEGEQTIIFEKRRESEKRRKSESERRYEQREKEMLEEFAKTIQARREGRMQ